MILDNENKNLKVHEWISKHTENGTLSIVTGYFTVGALAYLSKLSITKCRATKPSCFVPKSLNKTGANPTVNVVGDGLFAEEKETLLESKLIELINTPKAFAALVDTAIFTLKKEAATDSSEVVYVDLRKPNANSFKITEAEWSLIKTSKENISGWERILERTFSALALEDSVWKVSHNCDGDN